MVDGVWFYSVIWCWCDLLFCLLIFIYLEELGDGDVVMNYVIFYCSLLVVNGCEYGLVLFEEYYV